MQHERGNEGKPVWSEWHNFRERARRTAYSPEEFSAIDRTRYDLDNDDPRSANITGRDNPDTYDGDDTQIAKPAGQPDASKGMDDPIHGPNPHRRRDRLLDIVEDI